MTPQSRRALLVFRRRYWPWCEDVLAAIAVVIFFYSIFHGHGWLPRVAEAMR
jgi:hypothetical protein